MRFHARCLTLCCSMLAAAVPGADSLGGLLATGDVGSGDIVFVDIHDLSTSFFPVTPAPTPSFVAADLSTQFVFWGSNQAGVGESLFRARIDGTEITQIGTINDTAAMAIDHSSQRLYVGSQFDKNIESMRFDGTDRQTFVGDAGSANTMDIVDGYVYWVRQPDPVAGTEARLHRAQIGNPVTELLASGLAPSAIAVEPGTQRIYYSVPGQIRRRELNGQNDTLLYNTLTGSSLTLDTDTDTLYFSNFAGTALLRASADGSGSVELVATGFTTLSSGIEIGRTNILWFDYEIGPQVISTAGNDVVTAIEMRFDVTQPGDFHLNTNADNDLDQATLALLAGFQLIHVFEAEHTAELGPVEFTLTIDPSSLPIGFDLLDIEAFHFGLNGITRIELTVNETLNQIEFQSELSGVALVLPASIAIPEPSSAVTWIILGFVWSRIRADRAIRPKAHSLPGI